MLLARRRLRCAAGRESARHPVLRGELRRPLREGSGRAFCPRLCFRTHAHPLHALQQLHQVRSVPRYGRSRSAPNTSPPGTTRASSFDSAGGRYLLRQGVDASRDQSYFLFGLTQDQLSRTSFPLGGMQKSEVRALAAELGIPWRTRPKATKSASSPTATTRALSKRISSKPAAAWIASAARLSHRRQGFGRAFRYSSLHDRPAPWPRRCGRQTRCMWSDSAGRPPRGRGAAPGAAAQAIQAGAMNWISIAELNEPLRVQAKIRHQFRPAPAMVRPTSDPQRVEVEFDEPQPAVTPGQAAVFYDQDLVSAAAGSSKQNCAVAAQHCSSRFPSRPDPRLDISANRVSAMAFGRSNGEAANPA